MAITRNRPANHPSREQTRGILLEVLRRLAQDCQPDFTVQNEFTLFLLRPHTPAAQTWIDANLASDHMMFGGAVVIESRYLDDIINGVRTDGLVIG